MVYVHRYRKAVQELRPKHQQSSQHDGANTDDDGDADGIPVANGSKGKGKRAKKKVPVAEGGGE